MQKNWKQFVALDTRFGADIFSRARLRLTALYVIIITVILIVFSQVILAAYGRYMESSVEIHEISENQEYTIIQEAENELQIVLLFVNGGIIVLTAGFGYFLAGKTLEPIKKILENQKRFLSDASHELRTPLAVLKTNMEVELAGTKYLNKTQRENLESNLEEVDTMAKLVNDLLLLSRLDVKDNKMKTGVVDIGEIIGIVKKRMNTYAKKRSVTLQFPQPVMGYKVDGDKELLLSSFSNLIKNAIDYNKQNGEVFVRIVEQMNDVEVSIADTGLGIGEEKLTHIFDRFYRGDVSREEVTGTGLGLSISKAIIDKHGGHISIESTENEGTTVRVQLPLRRSS